MRAFKVLMATMALTTIGVMPAAAQEAGTVGLTLASESTVGLTIQATGRIAVRPEVGFTRSTSEGTGSGGKRTTSSWSPGLSLLFYVKSWDNTRLYLSPRWLYSSLTSADAASSFESKATGNAVSAMLGAQHNITERFAAFGEVGIGRSSSKSDSGLSSSSSNFWSTRSTVGAIVFF